MNDEQKNHGFLHAGNEVWRTALDDIFYSSPIELNQYFYAKGSSHTIYAIVPESGFVQGILKLEYSSGLGQPEYEAMLGVYRFDEDLLVNTKNAILVYK